ncbi:MAG TPA: TIGR03435 family protein, partial [Bryobacteraceae bacterium]|nr:TIGR03435 family protein [Bryobacteraceae bacterium]
PIMLAQPTFEAISIHPRPSDRQGYLLTRECKNDRFRAANEPLSWIVEWAYGVADYQTFGLPEWTNSFEDSYDINAEASAPASEDQCRAMVRTMFADRFQLQSHRETRSLPVYELTLAKGGPKLSEVGPDGIGKGAIVNGRQWVDSATPKPPAGWPISRLASTLALAREIGDRPVIDKTGLTGVYSFSLSYSTKPDDGKPSVFTALEEQLGLKLVASKAPTEVLVIDRIEKPSAN